MKQAGPGSRLLQVLGTAALALAFAGYAAGVHQSAPPDRAARTAEAPHAERAPSYTELRSLRRGANSGMYEGALDALVPVERASASADAESEEQRLLAVQARSTRRAFDGAPPTIPHAVDQHSTPDCLACHERGATIAKRTAPRPSHPRYDSCTQCHVVSNDPRPGRAPVTGLTENTFVGLSSPTRGERAWPGAPPTIPHPTLMRSQCSSCHGPGGRAGLRTSHPQRQSCTQCHAPSAVLDQRPTVAESR